MLKPDAQLLADARRITTGGNVHTVATLVAYYVNELEVYNATSMVKDRPRKERALDCAQRLEQALRDVVYSNK
jgi:hypothetical protein